MQDKEDTEDTEFLEQFDIQYSQWLSENMPAELTSAELIEMAEKLGATEEKEIEMPF